MEGKHIVFGVAIAALLAGGVYWQIGWSAKRQAIDEMEERSRWPLSRWCAEPKPGQGEYVELGPVAVSPAFALGPKARKSMAVALTRCDGSSLTAETTCQWLVTASRDTFLDTHESKHFVLRLDPGSAPNEKVIEPVYEIVYDYQTPRGKARSVGVKPGIRCDLTTAE